MIVVCNDVGVVVQGYASVDSSEVDGQYSARCSDTGFAIRLLINIFIITRSFFLLIERGYHVGNLDL
jgi:hypothetical protein